MRPLLTPILLGALLSSCATPVPPSGGPRDETPPEIVETLPPADAVNVDRETIRITFSEYVNESAFAQAFSITPAFDRQPEFAWSGRTVVIHMPDQLRENTTYVITLDTNLQDAHSVALTAPTVFAFSTGPTISQGTLAGNVVTADAGQPAQGVDVYAYAVPDSAAPSPLPERPDYRTQTNESGAFRFDYLTEQLYFVAVLRDQNRNRAPDPQEAYAPPPVAAVRADTTPVEIDVPWVLTRKDTTRPTPVRVQSLSQSRHLLRLSEAVRFTGRDASTWTVTDSAAGESVPVMELYMSPSAPQEVYFTTPPLGPTTYGVLPAALADSSGNLVLPHPATFVPAAVEDTLQVRFQGFLPPNQSTLARGVEPGLRFNAPIGRELLSEVVSVIDSTGRSLGYAAVTLNGTEYELRPDPPLSPGDSVTIRVNGTGLANPDSVYAMSYVRVPRSETGEISGVVLGAPAPVYLRILPVEVDVEVPEYEVTADSAGAFIFNGLPAGTYRIRAFSDEDSDGEWDGGMLEPYRDAEPIIWRNEPARVRARWETSLPDTLRFPSP